MRSSNISSRFDRARGLALCACAIVLASCSKSSGGAASPASCQVELDGDFSEKSTLPSTCATVAPSQKTPGDWTLSITGSTPHLGQLVINVDLGASPSAQTYTPDNASDWAIIAQDADDIDSGTLAAFYAEGGTTSCAYTAGASAVPTGTFTLNLTQATTTGAPSAHGTLTAMMHVHAPPGGNCGPSDIENISFAF